VRTSFHHQSEAQPPNGTLTAATSPDTPSDMPATQSVSVIHRVALGLAIGHAAQTVHPVALHRDQSGMQRCYHLRALSDGCGDARRDCYLARAWTGTASLAPQVDGGGAKKHRRLPSGRLQRQNSPSGDGWASVNGTASYIDGPMPASGPWMIT
jgi:hypothetical protein